MHFLMTRYIQPIKTPVHLSTCYNIKFDNPRTHNEIRAVRMMLESAWDIGAKVRAHEYLRLPIAEELSKGDGDILTLNDAIEEVIRINYPRDEANQLIDQYSGDKDDTIDFYARNWVIMRIGGGMKRATNGRPKLATALFADGDPFLEREKEVNGYVRLLVLLLFLNNREENYSWSILLTESMEDIEYYHPKVNLMEIIRDHGIFYASAPRLSYGCKISFTEFMNEVKDISTLIDSQIQKNKVSSDVVDYIGGLLTQVKSGVNDCHALVQAVSIIELLLTHQPYHKRFNVEDSITKQFTLKATIVVRAFDSSVDLSEVRSCLKKIYELRSKIVHGDFKALRKYSDSLGEEQFFSDIVEKAYIYASVVVKAYIEDPQYINFLKDN